MAVIDAKQFGQHASNLNLEPGEWPAFAIQDTVGNKKYPFKQGDKLVSADTLNKYVHSTNFAPSPEHLMSIWDSLADVIVELLRA